MCHYNTKSREEKAPMIAHCILDAREKRATKQVELIEQYHVPVMSFTINAPGENKNNERIKKIFSVGKEAINSMLDSESIQMISEYTSENLLSGPEALFALDAKAIRLKELSLSLEHQHPLGRLFDIDIIDLDKKSISRRDLGYESRKCIVCQDDAKICARSQRHDMTDVIAQFNRIYDDYIK